MIVIVRRSVSEQALEAKLTQARIAASVIVERSFDNQDALYWGNWGLRVPDDMSARVRDWYANDEDVLWFTGKPDPV